MRRIVLALYLVTTTAAVAQNSASLLTDALYFRRSELTGKTRLDVYVAVPYTILQFSELDDRFAAQYSVKVTLRDSLGRTISDTTITKSAVEESYQITQGSTGKTDNSIVRFNVKPGRYRKEITVNDKFSHRDYSTLDTMTVPNLQETPSLSALMYVSQIEQKGNRYAITPYIGSLIWNAEQNLFVFYEAYTDELPLNVAFSWVIASSDGRTVGSGLGEPMQLTNRTTQTFLPLNNIARTLPSRYTLTVKMHPVSNGVADTTTFIAQEKKPYIIPRTAAGAILTDVIKATKQLAYVAEQPEIDYILAATNQVDQQFRFEEFWKRRDPTPNTLKNEAFDEYYARVETADKRFKTYVDGWKTDMGMVYVIFGEPANIERILGQTGSVVAVKWTYNNGTGYLFEDQSGFGDLHLRVPLPSGVKYKYR